LGPDRVPSEIHHAFQVALQGVRARITRQRAVTPPPPRTHDTTPGVSRRGGRVRRLERLYARHLRVRVHAPRRTQLSSVQVSLNQPTATVCIDARARAKAGRCNPRRRHVIRTANAAPPRESQYHAQLRKRFAPDLRCRARPPRTRASCDVDAHIGRLTRSWPPCRCLS